MNRKNPFARFYLDDHRVLDEKIDTISQVDRASVLHNGKDLLRFERQANTPHFVGQAHAIGPLQQTATEPRVDGVRGMQDAAGAWWSFSPAWWSSLKQTERRR